ncbi:MAG: hypothetical protein ACK5HO_03305 [Pseudomonadota bacterium]
MLDITIGCCFDSHPRIDSVLQNSGFRYGLLENTIGSIAPYGITRRNSVSCDMQARSCWALAFLSVFSR